MNLVIIKYNAGNIRSVLFALERIGMNALVTDDPEQILRADKVIFPGVGEASSAMQYLRERQLDTLIAGLKQPVLGICLGLQLMCRFSEENDTNCLGIFDEVVKKFEPPVKNWKLNSSEPRIKVPQIGWNSIYGLESELFKGLPENSFCYFVHGYFASLGAHTIARADYIQPYSAGLHRDNFFGVQFHPEKSSLIGEKIIKNFIAL
ncbi:MAG: imidazole glycerol phosphate synthase subunit HisH [Terrimonas sp.]|nr:imidazole glycerol phosphate synthase subunit HisH [Terrimonas sp.]